MILNFNDFASVKKNVWNKATVFGKIKEINFLDYQRKKMQFSSLADLLDRIDEIAAIWLNSYKGASRNHEYSILILDEAIKSFIEKYKIMTDQEINKRLVICNNVVVESMSKTDKPHSKIYVLDEDLSLEETAIH